MGVPKRKVSRSRRDSRATRNMAIKKGPIAACQTCQAPLSSHQACPSCGYYKGVKVLTTKRDRLHKRNETRRAHAQKVQARSGATSPEQKDKE